MPLLQKQQHSSFFSSLLSLILSSTFLLLLSLLLLCVINNNHNLVCAQSIPPGVGTYDIKDVCFAGLGFPRLTPPDNVNTTTDTYHLSTFEPLPRSSGYVPAPIVLGPIAVAYNSTPILSYPNQQLTLEISMETIGEWLMGTLADQNQSVTPSTSTDVPVGLAQLKFVLANESKVTRAFIYRMWERNIPGFTSPWEVPAAVLANLNITIVSSDDEVIAALQSVAGSQGLVGLVPISSGVKFPSFSVSITNARGDVPVPPSSLSQVKSSRFTLVSDLTLSTPQAPDIVNRVNFNFTFTFIGSEPIYPLIGTLFLNFPVVTVNCSNAMTQTRIIAPIQTLNELWGLRLIDTRILLWNMVLINIPIQALVLAQALDVQPCLGGLATVLGGSDLISTLMFNYNLKYISIGSALTQYIPYGSANAAALTFSRVARVGASELALTNAQLQASPTFSAWPGFAFGLAVCFNLPKIDTFFLNRCKILDVFNGTIKYWDELSAENPSVALPHVPINIVLSTAPSGTYTVFLNGLRQLQQQCGFDPDQVTVSSTWNLHVTTAFGNERDALAHFAASPFSLSITAGVNVANDASLKEAYLLDTTTYAISSTNAADVEAAISQGTIVNEATGEVDLSAAAASGSAHHPFVGYTYFIAEVHAVGASANCAGISTALKMMYWIMTDDVAQAIARENGYVPFPKFIQENGVQKLAQSTCNNLYLFPHLIHNTTELDLKPIIAGSVAGFVVLVAIFVGVAWYLANRGKRSAKYAAKDRDTPFALIFTDIQASTTLWSVAPQAMAVSLDLHNEIIDRNIEYFEGYKVKTIGDAYMICVTDIKKAHEMCLAIQRDLYNAEWPSDEIDMAYGDLFQDEESPYQMHNIDGSEITYKQRRKMNGAQTELYINRTNPSLFHGVSIRIGMTWGTAEPKVDPVTNAYDYFGPNVNLASRCESCGNGGQTVYSSQAIEALRDAGVDLTDINSVAIRSLGKQNLKGIPAPVELYQVLPVELGGRLFPPLRLDKDGAMTLELESESESQSKSNSTMDTSVTGFSMNSNHSKSGASFKYASQRSQDPNHTSGDPSAASTNGQTGSSIDEDDTSPKDFQFAKFLSKQTRIDPRLLLLVYDVNRSLVAATPSEKVRRQMIDTLAKDWRCQDFKTKHHLHFKKELGYEEYWTMRIASKQFGGVVTKQRKRDPRHEFKLNLMRRGAIRVDDLDNELIGGSSSATTDGTSGGAGGMANVFEGSSRHYSSNASVGDSGFIDQQTGNTNPNGDVAGGGGGGALAPISITSVTSTSSAHNSYNQNQQQLQGGSGAVVSRSNNNNNNVMSVAIAQSSLGENQQQRMSSPTPPPFHFQQQRSSTSPTNDNDVGNL